jgi:very-short-patch-repair endonuclease
VDNNNLNKDISLAKDPLPRRCARFVRHSSLSDGGRAGWVSRFPHYEPLLKERASQLRKHMTLAEVLLWNQLKNKQISGYDFDRQRPLGHYIVDFLCKKLHLAIEIDGKSHDFRAKQDTERQKQIENMGIKVIQFWDHEVKHDIKSVVDRIRELIFKEEQTHPGLQATPPKEGIKTRKTGNPESKIEPC